MIYFTSDLHLGHEAIITLCDRPFKSIEEMNQTIIDNWNGLVNDNDIVYILGDLSYRISPDEVSKLVRQLKGHKIFLLGNHDFKLNKYDASLFEEICDYKEIKYNKRKFVLFHYPIVEWNGCFEGSIHLHGHQHNLAPYNQQMKEQGLKRYDVGVDANDFRPLSIDEIIDFIEK